MKRRELIRAAGGMAALGALAAMEPARAQAKKIEEGTDYLRLKQPAPVDAPAGQIEVVDFFWYNCPHCNAFEPSLEAWMARLPADVKVKRVPVGFRDDFVPQQRLFYTLEALGLVDALHAKVFHAVHQEHRPMDRMDVMADWIQTQGVDRAKFIEAYNSFSVSAKQRRAQQIQDAYKVEGVPAMGVAGRFYVDGNLAGSNPRMLPVTDYLVAEIRKGGAK
ncbi:MULTISPECIES: thiol:disulfide interchange protein DsbA/DsbL [Ramlibacter]|uniref:Thiol:disulfide interchange protein n=1 Tax=Ramlibacter aquaticus TaxID=2780094 RepID=A0ABR9SDI8_9BURK|nr:MULTISPECIES: thiol:disulfide interchange protein DsbA/DsbL [Ramlibacter]MBE7940423.1 thiol:disulfide interchange protein DsbA/DsbL [Ramlibacter aquaticus]